MKEKLYNHISNLFIFIGFALIVWIGASWVDVMAGHAHNNEYSHANFFVIAFELETKEGEAINEFLNR